VSFGAWGKVDGDFFSHPKALRAIEIAGPGTIGLWAMALSYTRRYQLNGYVPPGFVRPFAEGDGPRLAHALVACAVKPAGHGLWLEDHDRGGWVFYKFAKYNPPTPPHLHKHRSDAGAKGGKARAERSRQLGLIPPPSKLLETCLETYTGIGNGDLDLGGGGGGGGGREVTEADFEDIYAAYPHKEGKARGMDILRRKVRTLAELARLNRAVLNYAEKCRVERTEPRFIKHWKTFANCYEDYVDLVVVAPTAETQPRTRGGRTYGVAMPAAPDGDEF